MRLRSSFGWVLGALALVSCRPASDPAAELREAAEPEIPRHERIVEAARTAVRLSPDGRQLAFVVEDNGVANLWLAPVDDPEAARALTSETGSGVGSFRWAYSSEYLLYRRNDESSPLLALDVADGSSRSLSGEEAAGELVHLSPRHPGVAMIAVAAAEPDVLELWRVELAGGDPELIEAGVGVSSWGIDDDLDLRLAFETVEGGGLRVKQRAETGDWVDQSWLPEQGDVSGFLGFDGSSRIAYFLAAHKAGTVAVIASHVVAGTAELIFQDRTADVAEVLAHPEARTPQAVAVSGSPRRWCILDEAVRADLDYLKSLATGDLEVIDRSLDDTAWLAAIVPPDAPRRFYLYDREAGEARLVFGGRPLLAPRSRSLRHSG